MPRLSKEVERKQCEGKNGKERLVAGSLVVAGLNGTAGGAIAVARSAGGLVGFGGAAEKLEAREGFQLAMGHEWHPGERQRQSEHCFNRPHA